MLFQIVEKFLSSARLHPYKVATNGNEALTLALYADNLRIAQSFYTCLSVFEVAFRNSMHDSLMTEFHSSNWLLEQQSGFMTDKRLIYISKEGKEAKNEKVLNMVKAALKEFKERLNYSPANGNVLIAELPFGFWTTLFSKKYFEILNKVPLYAFPARPKGTSWEVINSKLTRVRTFRNRVYHYEPLCFQQNSSAVLCFQQLHNVHNEIIELLSWISPEMAQWLAEFDLVPEKLKNLHKKYPQAT